MTDTERLPPAWLPGDPEGEAAVARMIRVDHAGEYGAVRIYEGQLAVLGRDAATAPMLRHMLKQEREHLATFERLIVERRVRPSVLSPLWHVSGWLLGAGTALMGPRAAMACTAAVEEVIDDHYAAQRDALRARGGEDALVETIERFRQEEVEHRDTAVEHGAADAPAAPLLSTAIRAGARLAIRLAERA